MSINQSTGTPIYSGKSPKWNTVVQLIRVEMTTARERLTTMVNYDPVSVQLIGNVMF